MRAFFSYQTCKLEQEGAGYGCIKKDTRNQIVTDLWNRWIANAFPEGQSLGITFPWTISGEKTRQNETQALLSSTIFSQRFTLSCLRTRSMKNLQQFSLISINPDARTSGLTLPMMFSTSSSGNRSGISPWMSKTSNVNQTETQKNKQNTLLEARELQFYQIKLAWQALLPQKTLSLTQESAITETHNVHKAHCAVLAKSLTVCSLISSADCRQATRAAGWKHSVGVADRWPWRQRHLRVEPRTQGRANKLDPHIPLGRAHNPP